MKMYIKTRNKFLGISIILLLISLYVIYISKNETFGYFLLGIFASTIIISLQAHLSSQIEESKLIVEKIRNINDLSYKFIEIEKFSLEYFSYRYVDAYNEYKGKLLEIFEIKDQLGNISDLNNKTKKELNIIIMKVEKLEMDLTIIFNNFDKSGNKIKIMYFIEFYNILKTFNFKELRNMCYELGEKLDSNEFYREDFKKDKKRKQNEIEYQTSINIYNKELEEKHKTVYSAMKKDFEIGNNKKI